MSPYVVSILMMSLGLGTVLTFSSSHWLLAWMGLEINTLAIIPLMARYHHPRAVEATTKYFLTQSAAAAVILFASVTNAWMTGQWELDEMTHPAASALILSGLALKVGLAPLHFWLPEVLQGISLQTGLILSTWQKLAPLSLLIQISADAHPHLLAMFGLTSALVGGWGGMNQTQLRKILAYSSIAHLGWMIMISQAAPHLTLLALVIYIVMTTAAFLTLTNLNATMTVTLASAWAKSPAMAALACLILLSLGGLPPLTGFMPKWLILQELTAQGLTVLATAVALAALLSLYFYLRLSYAAALTLSPHTTLSTAAWRTKKSRPTLPLSIMIVLATSLLPLTPTILGLIN
uniref:NADH-ubiquinone oxidoreductase chain 2 n=1 Tax=Spratelloides delicatulus TaxID=373251 RepID=A5PIM6_9TELE|nr:NADH dehydrogenase subunit 2 [Spratelloides delicatulus]BAF64115.1 NADH dehydrogenase subunit 2 [Spratelloides delicatulus]